MSIASLDELAPPRPEDAARGSLTLAERAASVAATLLVVGIAASVKIALANVLLGGAALAWIVALAGGSVRWRRSSLWPATAAWIVATLAAVALSRNPAASAGESGELATLLLLPIVVTLLDGRRWDRLLGSLAVVASISSLVGIGQYLAGASDLAHRLRGLTTHYMTFSGWTLVVTLLLVGDAAFHSDRSRRRWSVPAAALCTVALLLSFTRNAWVGLAAGLTLAVLLWRPRALIVLPPLVLLAASTLPGAVRARAISIFDLREPSNHDRLCMVRSGLEMAASRPLAGMGMGMVESAYAEFRLPSATRERVPHLHCNVVQIAAERGLLGVAAYLSLLGVFAARCRRQLADRSHPDYPMVAGCLLAVAGISVAGLFEYNWGDAEVWIPTLMCLAAPFAVDCGRRRVDDAKVGS